MGTRDSWQSSNAFNKWRSILSERGLYVFKEAFKTNTIAGFCIYDELFPIIFINNTEQSENRQIFTLFHELGHLIYQNSYLDVIDNRIWNSPTSNSQEIEIKCNKFASHFLLPDVDFKKRFMSDGKIDNSDTSISEIANFFHVSREVILRRMLDKKLISQQFYSDKCEDWNSKSPADKKKKDTNKKPGGNYYNTKMSYLGDAYLSLVLNGYYGGSISIEQASNYLDIQIKSFNGIEYSFLKRKGL